jgi:hypothetical protein
MRQRQVRQQDVLHALAHAENASPTDSGSFRVEGPDIDGDELVVVVAIEDGIVVVTVF